MNGLGKYFNSFHEPTIIPNEVLDKSFISSREYEERFIALLPFNSYMGIHMHYLKHLDKPLWVADSLVQEEVQKELVYCEKEYPDTYNFNKEITTRAFHILTTFKNQRKRTFSPNKFTETEIATLKNFYQKVAINNYLQSFSIRKTGWHNIDYFYKKEQMQETLLKVTCQEEAQKVMLIFKNDKVVLSASKNTANDFCFNRNGECTLPIPAVPAYLIALGEKDGKLIFAKKEIQLGQDTQVSLDLKPSSQEELTKVLEGIEQGNQ